MFRYRPDSDFGRLSVAAAIFTGVALFATAMSEHAATRRYNANNPFLFVGHKVGEPKVEETKVPPRPPEGRELVRVAIGSGAGFVTAESRVDVIASARVSGQVRVFKLLANVPVGDVGRRAAEWETESVGLALAPKEVELIELATSRGCTMRLVLRNPNRPADDHDLDAVFRLLDELARPVAPSPPRPAGEER